jgi:mRNA-degrading endonuclease RelE of RelBE toxin-antitoxin system
MYVCFVELEGFTKEVMRLADEETLRQFQMELAMNPERRLDSTFGRVAQGSNEIARRGRSSGARVIYMWLPNTRRFILFMLYTKARQRDIPPAILARLRTAVETIKAKDNR